MFAFRGKADMTRCGCLLSRSLSGEKRTYLFAPHMSAFDPKRTSEWTKTVTILTSFLQPTYLYAIYACALNRSLHFLCGIGCGGFHEIAKPSCRRICVGMCTCLGRHCIGVHGSFGRQLFRHHFCWESFG